MRTGVVPTRVLATGVLALAGVLLFAAPAQAHSYLVSSTPAADETLTELPAEFSISMNENLADLTGDGTGFGMLVQDAAGRYYGDGCVTISGATLSTPAALGEAGTYRLSYGVISADLHPVEDEITFEWAPGEGFAPQAGSTDKPNCGGEATPAEPAETGAPDAAPDAAISSDVFWIGGGILAVLVAVGVTLLLVRPRKEDSTPAE